MATTFAAAQGVLATDQTDSVMLFHVPSGEYFTLDDVAALVWRSAADGADEAGIVQAVVTSYDIDAGIAAEDVRALLNDLQAAGLLTPGAAP